MDSNTDASWLHRQSVEKVGTKRTGQEAHRFPGIFQIFARCTTNTHDTGDAVTTTYPTARSILLLTHSNDYSTTVLEEFIPPVNYSTSYYIGTGMENKIIYFRNVALH